MIKVVCNVVSTWVNIPLACQKCEQRFQILALPIF